MPAEESRIAQKIFQLASFYSKKLIDLLLELGEKKEKIYYFILVEFLAFLLHLTSRLTFVIFPPAEHNLFMNSIYLELLLLNDRFLEQSGAGLNSREHLMAYCAETLAIKEQEYAGSRGFFLKSNAQNEMPLFWLFVQSLSRITKTEQITFPGEVLAADALKELGRELSHSLSV